MNGDDQFVAKLPRAVFRVCESEHGLRLVIDVTTDPVEVIAEVRGEPLALALSTLLGRHSDEFCDLVHEYRNREPF